MHNKITSGQMDGIPEPCRQIYKYICLNIRVGINYLQVFRRGFNSIGAMYIYSNVISVVAIV